MVVEMQSYFDLGRYWRKEVTAANLDASNWFNRGLIWSYAYNHKEAITCFQRAIDFDPSCAMGYWGIAFALGPNYNKPWETFEDQEKAESIKRAQEAVFMAQTLKGHMTATEGSLIDAISLRYPKDVVDDISSYHDAYAAEMRIAYENHSDDLDVCCLFADALMNRTPWKLWDQTTGKPAQGADTLEAKCVLETAFDKLDGAWEHPGLLHAYIHCMEMSPHPEKALRHGDALSKLTPDCGHLRHMATHIDVLCGDYFNVVERNTQAVQADTKFLNEKGSLNFYTLYICHNLHFLIYGAMFLGQKRTALKAAEDMIRVIPEALVQALPNWFECFISMKQHVLIRFGCWDDIVLQELPQDKELYAVTTAMVRYARAVAYANLKQFKKAEAECELFLEAKRKVTSGRMLFNNTATDLLAIAKDMALGEIYYHQGLDEEAFRHLRQAVELDDNLPYDEPWGWMQPTRHALGALLIDRGRYKEAEEVYRADLGLDSSINRSQRHPNNVWSLHGLYECLANRAERLEIKHIKILLDKAVARADVPISASCYCRKVKTKENANKEAASEATVHGHHYTNENTSPCQ